MSRFLITLFVFLSVAFTKAFAQDYSQQQSEVNTSESSGQYMLTGIVYLGTNFPAAGAVVYVISNGKRISTVVDQNGSFTITFEASDSWEFGIEGYSTEEYVYLVTKSVPVFRMYVNIYPKQK